MSKRKPAEPVPAVGDFVLIGSDKWLDPYFWWISEVAWTDGDFILVYDGTGTHPTRQPTLNRVRVVVAFGTKDRCFEIKSAADRAAREHDASFRDANAAIDQAKDARRAATTKAVASYGRWSESADAR